jgi:predicted RNA-binding protein with PIN domain
MVKGTSRISFSINNKSIINGYNVRAEKPELKQINLKQVELVEGYNELAVKILDSSEFQGSNYGIEFLKFKKL